MTAWIEYHRALTALHVAAGLPSTRDLARRTGTAMSHATVNDLLSGRRLSKWSTVLPLVQALGADEETRERLFELFRRAEIEQRRRETPGAPVVSRRAPSTMLEELQAIRELLEQRLPAHEVTCPNCGTTIRAAEADS